MRDTLSDLLDDTCDIGTENEGVLLDEEIVFSNLSNESKQGQFPPRRRNMRGAIYLPVDRLNRYGMNLGMRKQENRMSTSSSKAIGNRKETTHFDDDFTLLSSRFLCRIDFELLFGRLDPSGRVANHCRRLRDDGDGLVVSKESEECEEFSFEGALYEEVEGMKERFVKEREAEEEKRKSERDTLN